MITTNLVLKREARVENERKSGIKKRAREGLQYLLEPNLQAFPLWGG